MGEDRYPIEDFLSADQLNEDETLADLMEEDDRSRRQLRSALGNRYFGEVDELRSGIRSAMEEIDPPGIYQYHCR